MMRSIVEVERASLVRGNSAAIPTASELVGAFDFLSGVGSHGGTLTAPPWLPSPNTS